MWALYRNTFLRIQALIAVVTTAVFIVTDLRLPAAAVFFAVMQIGAVIGAVWSRPARRWIAMALLAVGFLGIAGVGALADDTPAPAASTAPAAPPQPDRTGASQSTPTAYSVPGYTKPDPDKATTKQLATAVDAVAQSTSHTI